MKFIHVVPYRGDTNKSNLILPFVQDSVKSSLQEPIYQKITEYTNYYDDGGLKLVCPTVDVYIDCRPVNGFLSWMCPSLGAVDHVSLDACRNIVKSSGPIIAGTPATKDIISRNEACGMFSFSEVEQTYSFFFSSLLFGTLSGV